MDALIKTKKMNWLCRLGFHKWVFYMKTGKRARSWEECERCGEKRK